jgi:hypothetical protein
MERFDMPPLIAKTSSSRSFDSIQAGEEVGTSLKRAFGQEAIQVVVLYGAVNYDQAAIIRGLRGVVGNDVAVLGCSSQGFMTRGTVQEGGYHLGAMGLGGRALKSGTAVEYDIAAYTRDKGARLAKSVLAKLGGQPKLFVLLYDPVTGVDASELIAGAREHLRCPIVGGGASQPWGTLAKTYQYYHDEVLNRGAVALGLDGPFTVELGVCHGTSPIGLTMTITRAVGNRLLEIDDRPALDVWRQITDSAEGETSDLNHFAAWAIGVERSIPGTYGRRKSEFAIRAAYSYDADEKSLTLPAAIPVNTKIMFHHRTIAAVMEGTNEMARQLAERMRSRNVWAVLGFECGARTSPFLGIKSTIDENLALQEAVAPDAPWLCLMALGEIAPLAGEPTFHNYTYPLVVLSTG